MTSPSLVALIEISIRALALGLVGGLTALLLRRAGAHLRHAVWLSVLAGMLALPLLAPLVPPMTVTLGFWRAAGPDFAPLVPPASSTVAPVAAPPARWRPGWQAFLWAAYALGAALLLARQARGALRLRRLVAAGTPEYVEVLGDVAPPVGIGPAAVEVRSSPAVTVPFTAGVLRPLILLPADWREWPRTKLAAVLAHEVAHIARRDWFTARLAAFNRCLFWFHPLAWWLERKLASLAEESADQTALAVMNDPRSYAGAILDFAFAMQARRLHSMEATAMARSTKVGRRVERILSSRHFAVATFRRGAVLLIILCAVPFVWAAASLLPVPQAAPVGAAQVYIRGDLTEGEAAELESRLASSPADFPARMRLIGYYLQKGDRDQALKHAWWLAENHPERGEALAASLVVVNGASESDKIRLGQVWSRPSENPTVLVNAAQLMLALGRLFDAESYFQRARKLGRERSTGLEALYARTLRSSTPAGGSTAEWTLFANKVKSELDITPDAALVGAVGEMLVGTRDPQIQDLAEKYLKRAQTLDGANPRWQGSLERLKIARAGKPVTAAPGRIRVGGNVQQSKLISQVRPDYPPLAKQARIQGTVRLSAEIAADGTVKSLQAESGHPLLVPAAMEAVRRWVYQPTLLNGQPVEVVTMIDVNFTLSGESGGVGVGTGIGVVGGVPGGVRGGAGGGVPGGVREGPPYRVGGGVSAPSILRKLEPSYPEALRHLGLTGTVVLRAVIGADGKVSSAMVTHVEGRPEFGEAAIDAVRQWVFKPGMKDGQPVDVEASIEVNFREM